jgi:hypothetical protein
MKRPQKKIKKFGQDDLGKKINVKMIKNDWPQNGKATEKKLEILRQDDLGT